MESPEGTVSVLFWLENGTRTERQWNGLFLVQRSETRWNVILCLRPGVPQCLSKQVTRLSVFISSGNRSLACYSVAPKIGCWWLTL